MEGGEQISCGGVKKGLSPLVVMVQISVGAGWRVCSKK